MRETETPTGSVVVIKDGEGREILARSIPGGDSKERLLTLGFTKDLKRQLDEFYTGVAEIARHELRTKKLSPWLDVSFEGPYLRGCSYLLISPAGDVVAEVPTSAESYAEDANKLGELARKARGKNIRSL